MAWVHSVNTLEKDMHTASFSCCDAEVFCCDIQLSFVSKALMDDRSKGLSILESFKVFERLGYASLITFNS